ncbi:MAG: potassium/chloride transporter 4/5/6 [Kiritimatiellia bacterium]|jgi:potassium/chloride transporter 4/5/6
MLFLRIGWVVGNAGLAGAIAIVVLANLITLFTSLSMSALATNMRVGVGGAYFLISRSLGLEVGGAIGIPLYLSQTLSITLYAYGLGESIGIFWPDMPGWIVRVVAICTVVLVTLVAARSTEFTLKAQLPVMGLIVLALLSLFLGVDWGFQQADTFGTYADPEATGFMGVFAVFFPAVTGVLAGVSLSGDLRDPRVAIPRGVLLAVATGFVIYMVVPVALAFSAPSSELATNKLIWMDIAWIPWLIVPGLWGAILSSAFGSILGAPRTLQALSFDGLAPKVLGKNDEKTGEPVLGLQISGGIALVAAIVLPDLNSVATAVTIFFLTTYGALNLVACIEALVGDPGFRPQIRVHWSISALGAIGCFMAMFLISPLWCGVAVVVEGIIFFVLSRRSLESTWGDVRTGLWLSTARWSLLRLRRANLDPRNWRPNILVFTSNLSDNVPMARLADNFGQHRGIVTIMELLVGEEPNPERIRKQVHVNQQIIDRAGMIGFCEVVAVPELQSGMVDVTQAHGFAGLQSNTVLLGFPRDGVYAVARLLRTIRILDSLEKSVMIYRRSGGTKERVIPTGEGRIVVWWKGREHNGDMMLLLAHLMLSTRGWRGGKIVLKSVARTVEEAKERRAEFASLLPDIRIDALVDVVVNDDNTPIGDVIRRNSRQADLVFVGLAIPSDGEEEVYAQTLLNLIEGLPDVLIVHNAGPFRGRLI